MTRTQQDVLYRRSTGHPMSIRVENLLGSGGEGSIYELDDHSDLVAKIYRRPKEAIGTKLTLMMDNPPEIETRGGHVSIAWPLDTLHSSRPANSENTVGFLMRKVSSMEPVNQCYTPGVRRRKFPHFTYKHLCAVAINIAIAVSAVHRRNYVIGDINETNFLVDKNGLVTLIDTDSFQVIDQVDGTIYRSPVGKPEFTPPELQGHRFDAVNRDQLHDRFGLGVIIYQLLMEGAHPFAGMYLGEGETPSIEDNISRGHFVHSKSRSVPLVTGPGYMKWHTLESTIANLFRLCLDSGHDNPIVRPTVFQWEETITRAAGTESLATCATNPQHLYFRHNQSCPWCERRDLLRGRDPYPLVPGPTPPPFVMRQVPSQSPPTHREKLPAVRTRPPSSQPTTERIVRSSVVPDVRLTLDAETILVGYRSDGSAEVRVKVNLRNEGEDEFRGSPRIGVAGVGESSVMVRRSDRTVLSLLDGYGPNSTTINLRVPMGVTEIELRCNDCSPLKVHMDVPERILGVERDVWDCYTDRELVPGEDKALYGRSGMSGHTVHKWLNDASIKLWATGDPEYVAVLNSVLSELAHILNLEFSWVEDEDSADIRAFMGVRRSEVMNLGFDDALVDFGGFAGSSTVSGETVSGYMVVWNRDDAPPLPLDEAIRGTVIHEALHVLVPMKHTTRPSSIMGGSGLTKWSSMDEELMRLNSDPLVRPGMTMHQVHDLIVFDDELLDGASTKKTNPMDMIWRAYGTLEEAGSIEYRIRGGWTDRQCNLLFGNRRGPVIVRLGEFRPIRGEPIHLHFDDRRNRFFVQWSLRDREWQHFQYRASQEEWCRVPRSTVVEATNWWLSHDKLHRTIRSLLMDGDPRDISVTTDAHRNIVLRAILNHSYVHLRSFLPNEKDYLDFVLELDPDNHTIRKFEWTLHKDPTVNPNACLTYREIGSEFELGVPLEVPKEVFE